MENSLDKIKIYCNICNSEMKEVRSSIVASQTNKKFKKRCMKCINSVCNFEKTIYGSGYRDEHPEEYF